MKLSEDKKRELLRLAIMRVLEELQAAIAKSSYSIASKLAVELSELCAWVANIDVPF